MRYGVNAYAHVSHTHTFINKPNPVAQLSATGVCEKNAHVRPSSLPHDHERPPIPHTMLTVCRTRCLLTGGRFFQFLVALPPNMAIQHCIWGQGGGPNIKKNDLGCRSISGKNGRFFFANARLNYFMSYNLLDGLCRDYLNLNLCTLNLYMDVHILYICFIEVDTNI